jgi:hypothetical protein
VASSPNPPPLSWQSESRLVAAVNREINLQGNHTQWTAFLQNRTLQAMRSESEINGLGIVHGRPNNFVLKIYITKHRIQHDLQIVAGRGVAVQ